MKALYLLCVGLHIFAAMTWIGGMAFMVLILVPTLRRSTPHRDAPAPAASTSPCASAPSGGSLSERSSSRAPVTSGSAASQRDFFTGRTFALGDWGRHLAEKLCVVLAILAISVSHDFWIGPRAVQLAHEAPGSPERRALPQLASWAGRLNFALALIVLALAIQFVR